MTAKSKFYYNFTQIFSQNKFGLLPSFMVLQLQIKKFTENSKMLLPSREPLGSLGVDSLVRVPQVGKCDLKCGLRYQIKNKLQKT